MAVVERWPLWRGGRCREVAVVERRPLVERWPLVEVRLYNLLTEKVYLIRLIEAKRRASHVVCLVSKAKKRNKLGAYVIYLSSKIRLDRNVYDPGLF